MTRVDAAGHAPGHKPSARRAPLGIVLPIVTLLLWECAARVGWVAAHQLPAPSRLWDTFVELVRTGDLVRHWTASALRVFAGYGAGVTVAVALGSAVALNPTLARLLDPSANALRAIPSLAWVPLLLLWLGIDEAPKITLIAIGAFFPVYLATIAGIGGADRKLLEVARLHRLPPLRMLREVYLPGALPHLLTGLRNALALSWMFLVAAEMMAASRGLGFVLTDGRETSRVDLVLVAIVLLALSGKITDTVLVTAERRLLGWRDVAERSTAIPS